MKSNTTQCDNCQKKEEINVSVVGYIPKYRWIDVRRGQSQTGDKIPAGTTHFCSDKCLADFATRELSNEALDPVKTEAPKA